MISKEFECLYCSKDKYYNGAITGKTIHTQELSHLVKFI